MSRMVEVLWLSVCNTNYSTYKESMLGMIPFFVTTTVSFSQHKIINSFFFAGEEQNKEALQDVEDENQ